MPEEPHNSESVCPLGNEHSHIWTHSDVFKCGLNTLHRLKSTIVFIIAFTVGFSTYRQGVLRNRDLISNCIVRWIRKGERVASCVIIVVDIASGRSVAWNPFSDRDFMKLSVCLVILEIQLVKLKAVSQK